jgi:hypothetical protein
MNSLTISQFGESDVWVPSTEARCERCNPINYAEIAILILSQGMDTISLKLCKNHFSELVREMQRIESEL